MIHGCDAAKLWRKPIEGVDFLDAGVADQERRFVRGDAGPVAESAAGGLESLHAEDTLQLAVRDTRAEIGFLAIENAVEINEMAIARPSWIGHEKIGEINPFLRREIKKFDVQRVQSDGGDVAAVRRPARRIQAV